jgi:hypothetical protein
MADRNTLEQDIDEVLGAPTAEAGPLDIDWEPAPKTVQAFDDMRDLPEEPEDSDEEDSEDGDGSGSDDDDDDE